MSEHPRNAPCPCGSGQKYKNCHGAAHAPPEPRGSGDPAGGTLENPFRRIFLPDGSVNRDYILSRLEHLEERLKRDPRFLGIRYDRDELERLLGEEQARFRDASGPEAFEEAFHGFAAAALPQLVTKEFDEQAKTALRGALQDPELTRRDRAAAACGLVLTLPPEGETMPQPHHENPFFDLVLRVTYNESVARAEFLAKLEEEGGSELEREAKIQEFLREVPALQYELREGFKKLMERALSSYQRGEYSFGIGVDMILRGVRAVRLLTQEYEEDEGDAFTDTQKKEFAERFGHTLGDTFAEDIGEDEEREIFARMAGFLDGARAAGAKKAVKGLTSALTIMEHNPEIRHRLLLAVYHEAVTGSRVFRSQEEEDLAQTLFRQPFDLENYLEFGAWLERERELTRAERIYRAAMEFFPEDQEVRRRLEVVATALEPARQKEVTEMLAARRAMEEEE